jgi:hypothetical protein
VKFQEPNNFSSRRILLVSSQILFQISFKTIHVQSVTVQMCWSSISRFDWSWNGRIFHLLKSLIKLSTRMHDTAAAGGYPLDSSADGGPQLELTTPRLRGRRSARRPDTAETQSTPPAPGPFNGARRRQDDRRDFAADRGRRRSARPPAWVGRPAQAAEQERPPPGRGSIFTRA